MKAIVPSQYEQSTLQETNIPAKLKSAALEGAFPDYMESTWGYVLSQHLERSAFTLYKFVVETREDMYLHFHNSNPSFTLFVAEKKPLQAFLEDFSLSARPYFAQLAYLPGPKDFRLYFNANMQSVFYKIDFNLQQLRKTAGYFTQVTALNDMMYYVAEAPAQPVKLEEIPLHKKEKDVFEQLAAELRVPGGASFFVDPRVADVLRWYISQLGREGDDALIASAGFFITREDLKKTRAIKTLLETNFSTRYPLRELATIAGLTPRKLQEVFKHDTGETISGFRSRVLMAEAGRLLKETSLPVKTIALSLGFKFTGDLDKLFKKSYGLKPRDWRNQPVV